MAKYLDVEKYIDRNKAYPNDHRITFMMLRDSLRNADDADVIPVEYIRKWYKAHYRVDNCTLINDYKRGVEL